MKSNTQVMALVDQLLRAQPRNALVAEVCAELRERAIDNRLADPAERPKEFDRTSYQRELMRKRRALAKANPKS